jgi:dTDP-4-dehydrorhamnose 3,5-epimerase
MNIDKPVMFLGNKIFDDRGSVGFVNDFDFKDVKRFYLVQNHEAGFIRAFHGHKKEGKYVTVVSGAAIIKVMPIALYEQKRADVEDILPGDEQTFVLSAEKPQVLWIPQGYFNGFKTMSVDTRVMFFSTATVEESKGDDIRIGYCPRLWESQYR